MLIVVLAMAGRGAAAQPQPVITISDTHGMAPWVVHVHATESDVGAGNALTARYEWDFGDPDGRYNTIAGFNAAHLYEQPGLYTITLRVTNEDGQQSQVTRLVTVAPNARQRLYVSPAGSDGNNGTSPSQAVRTLGRALDLLHNNASVLLRRGGTYNLPHSRTISNSNVVLGAYGAGGRPKLNWTGPLGFNAMVNITGGESDVVLRDLIFTSNWPADYDRDIVDGVRPGGENIAIVDCKFRNLSLAINGNQEPKHLLALGCHAEVIGAYFIWADGSDYCAIGNVVDGSHFEHCIRIGLAHRFLIHDNELANDDKRTIWGMHGTYMYVSNNDIDQGRMSVGPDPFGGSTTMGMRWSVFESNDLLRNTGGNGALECLAGASQIMIRNNVLRVDYLPAINISGYRNGMRVEDVMVYNNTGINTSAIGRFLSSNPGAQRIDVRNNLYVAPDLVTGESRTANIYVSDESLASFSSIARNVWAIPEDFNWVPDGYHYVWPHWSNAEGYKNPTEWLDYNPVSQEAYDVTTLGSGYTPTAGTVAAEHARPVHGVHKDFHGRWRRATGQWSAGAVSVDPADGPDPDPDPNPDPDPDPDPGDGFIAFHDDFETDRGWSVVSYDLADGDWQRGVPAGNGQRGDPESDYDGSGKCWLTGNRPGNSDVDGGPTVLTSPEFDLTTGTDPYLAFARWVYCDDGSDDRIVTEVSNDGGVSWTQVEIASSTGDWRDKEFRLSDFIAPTNRVLVRFIITDQPNNSVTEAAIDDFTIRYQSLDQPEPIDADLNGDGEVNVLDLLELLLELNSCEGDCTADINDDGVVNATDLAMMLSEL